MDFLSQLIETARRHPCTVVLPEARDRRVLTAAARAGNEGIARCVLLGERRDIQDAAAAANIALPESITITAPAADDYTRSLIQCRRARNKTIDEAQAHAMLANPATIATMLVYERQADAMVAGAITTSADVLRPALQIIGLGAGNKIASSAFLMCFDEGMKIFADCALNIAPDAEQLADIAVQSAHTAATFGLVPNIALLSYTSAGLDNPSGASPIHTAVDLIKQRLPQTPVTGPIQYDAAVCPEIAAIKLPGHPAAGHANVLIFPDLQAGNIAYKAVQQTGKLVSIGPIMQGLAAAVNDLSRGASAQDIYYTIAATVVQAAAINKQTASLA